MSMDLVEDPNLMSYNVMSSLEGGQNAAFFYSEVLQLHAYVHYNAEIMQTMVYILNINERLKVDMDSYIRLSD